MSWSRTVPPTCHAASSAYRTTLSTAARTDSGRTRAAFEGRFVAGLLALGTTLLLLGAASLEELLPEVDECRIEEEEMSVQNTSCHRLLP